MGAILICEHGTAVPVVLGALVVVALLLLGRWLVKKIKV